MNVLLVGSGVRGPEWFDPGMMEMESEYKRSVDVNELQRGFL